MDGSNINSAVAAAVGKRHWDAVPGSRRKEGNRAARTYTSRGRGCALRLYKRDAGYMG